ncbi:MAG: hypothetical protein FJ171_01840 [Gammaproteobacteria bacterium]|nr:hypothetical protein [Gammaproteobacteria bacterium]
MSAFNRLFTDHPATVDETYRQHFLMALGFGLHMIWGGLQCLVHAFVPGLFEKSGSNMIRELHERMVVNRHRTAQPQALPLETRKAA